MVKYEERKNEFSIVWNYIQKWKGIDKTIIIAMSGPSGTGKSSYIEVMAEKLGCEYRELDGNPGTTREDCEGVSTLVNGNSGWKNGAIPDAIEVANRDGLAVFAINEYNLIRPEVQASTNSFLDYKGRFRLTTDANRCFQIEDGNTLVVFVTFNENYAGTFEIQESVNSRFNFWVDCDYMPVDKEAKIVAEESGIDLRIAEIVCDVAAELRRATFKDDGTVAKAICIRGLISFCKAIQTSGWNLRDAFDFAIVNKITDDQSQKDAVYVLVDEGKNFFGKIQNVLDEVNKPKNVAPKPSVAKPVSSDISNGLSRKDLMNENGVINIKLMNKHGIALEVRKYANYKVNEFPKKICYNNNTYNILPKRKHNPFGVTVGKLRGKDNMLSLRTRIANNSNFKQDYKVVNTFVKFSIEVF